MTSVLPITLEDSNLTLIDNTNPNKELTISGRQMYITDTSTNTLLANIPTQTLIDRVSWSDAIVSNPGDQVLKLNNTLLLDNGVNSRTITPLSNPATSIDVSQTDASGLYYPVFTDVNGSAKSLSVDNAVGPLSYNPSTSTLTATRFNGTATQLNVVGSNVNQERPITVINSTTGGDRALVIDSQTNNFVYNVSLQRMSVNNIRTYGTISSPNNITIDPTNILTVQGDTEIFGQLDMENNNIVNCPQVRNNAGDIEIKANSSGAGGNISLTAGTDLLSATAGGNSGLHLKLTINVTAYKIALLNV
jgi:hypothetical protein